MLKMASISFLAAKKIVSRSKEIISDQITLKPGDERKQY